MAIVGPLINLAIAAVLYLVFRRWASFGAPDLFPASPQQFVSSLMGMNVALAVFNVIPAFPMDGGRVLRGALSLVTDYVRATAIAVAVGQALAMLFILYGIFFNWWLALIGFFIYAGAGAEKQQVLIRSALRGITARDAMVTDFKALRPSDTLADAASAVFHGCQDDFPVLEGGFLRGMLTRRGLLAAIHVKGLQGKVAEAMEESYPSVSPHAPLEDVYRTLATGDRSAAAVFAGTKLVGIICHAQLVRHLALRAALSGQPAPVELLAEA